MEKVRKKDIIRDSKLIREHIIKAMEENSLQQKDILSWAKKEELVLDGASISRYLSNDQSNKTTMTQEQVIWLCKKLKIDVDIVVSHRKNGKRS